MKKFLMLFLTILLILGISIPVSAADMGDTGKNIALTVVYKDAGTAVSGAPVKLYQIASMDKNFRIKAEPAFADFRSDIEDEDTRWSLLADALAEFIEDQKIPCDDETKINTSGAALFPTGNKKLLPGVYLLYCPKHTCNGKVYYASPVIISLPNYRSDGQLTNQVSANVKFNAVDNHPMDVTVQKKWDNRGHDDKQPDKITVDLLKDGNVVPGKTVELNLKNGWKHTWTDLEPAAYSVREKTVSGYTASYSAPCDVNDTRKITITNTYKTTSTGSGGGNNTQKLPQTGQLTWPIPVLTVSGMVLFSLGWWLCFGSRKEPHEK